jgi:hypothetical protein
MTWREIVEVYAIRAREFSKARRDHSGNFVLCIEPHARRCQFRR